ncbi:MAG TPA: nicotinate-nucleotide diphosphorylase (carboxylating), partial [Chloroflexota bacterium]
MTTAAAPRGTLAPSFPASADVQAIIRLALAEDVGRGDLTTEATVAADTLATAEILQKAPGVVCGLPVVEAVFHDIDPRVRVAAVVDEGSFDAQRRVVARLDGPAAAILSGERTALNFLQ